MKLLLFRGKIVVPAVLRSVVISEYHDSRGHFGSKRTIEMIKDQFWWPKLANDVIAYVSNCDVCQRTKADTRKTGGLQQPLPVPSEPWE